MWPYGHQKANWPHYKRIGACSLLYSCSDKPKKNSCKSGISTIRREKVVVSDINIWQSQCVFVNLFNREIIEFSTGPNKDAKLVARAFASVKGNLRDIRLFHTNRGMNFKTSWLMKIWKVSLMITLPRKWHLKSLRLSSPIKTFASNSLHSILETMWTGLISCEFKEL